MKTDQQYETYQIDFKFKAYGLLPWVDDKN